MAFNIGNVIALPLIGQTRDLNRVERSGESFRMKFLRPTTFEALLTMDS